MKTISLFLLLLVWIGDAGRIVERDFHGFFEANGVTGSFTMFDLKSDQYVAFNAKQCDDPFLPASTFKIFNSLVSLETAVIADEHEVIKWDSIDRGNKQWNKDTDLQSGFKNSTVWFYQELARRVGQERMEKWVHDVGYGNGDISGGIDSFWLTGGLRITPREQIEFLTRLYRGDLPFSPRTLEVVKRIMIVEETPDYILRAKTGWTQQDGTNIGWYVGYLERGTDVYIFATCIQCETDAGGRFGPSRIQITRNILHKLKLL